MIVRARRILLLAMLIVMPGVARAETDPTSDVAVKAAFLFNFAKFTDWPPAGPAAPLTLCVVGDARIARAAVETVRGQHIGSRGLDVKAIGSDAPMRACDVLFLSASESVRTAAVIDGLKALPVLTVSDRKGFANAGGIVEFFVENGRMRFIVNTDAADRSGLHLSSRLLGLAQIVRDDHVH